MDRSRELADRPACHAGQIPGGITGGDGGGDDSGDAGNSLTQALGTPEMERSRTKSIAYGRDEYLECTARSGEDRTELRVGAYARTLEEPRDKRRRFFGAVEKTSGRKAEQSGDEKKKEERNR